MIWNLYLGYMFGGEELFLEDAAAQAFKLRYLLSWKIISSRVGI